MGIVLGPNRHPKDVPFVSEFWWGRTFWALTVFITYRIDYMAPALIRELPGLIADPAELHQLSGCCRQRRHT